MKIRTFKKTVATAFMLSCAIASQAQINVSGVVKDVEQNPVPFSVIGIKNSFITTQSNAQGLFQITNLKPGTYVLLTKCVGYKPKEDTIVLSEDKSIEITLSQHDKSLDEVVVNATRVDNNSAFAHSNISADEINKQNLGQDLPYALNSMASVVVNSDAGNGVGYTGLRIRGSDATRINITVNGVPVNDAESQATFFVNMADIISSANSIQVQRGVGTSANGAGAFGASVNMQTNQLNEKPYAQVNNSFGSYNTMKNTIAAGTGLLNNHFTFDARASRIVSDGYVDRASSNLYSYYLAGGFYTAKTAIKAIMFSGREKTYQAWNYVLKDSIDKGNRTYNSCGEYYDANGNVKYYDNETDNYKQDNYQLHLIHAFNSKLTLNITGHYTKGQGYYEQYKQNQKLNKYNMPNIVIDSLTTITRTDLIRRRWLDNDFGGAIANLTYQPTTRLGFVLGGGYNNYAGKHFGEVIWAQFADVNNYKPRYYDNSAYKTDGNVYLKTTFRPIDKLTTFIDLQYRQVGYSFYGYDTSLVFQQQVKTSFGFFNPKVGLNYLLTKHTNVYASFAMTSKEPNRDDFVNSSRNSRPKPEELQDLEIGFTQRFKQVSLAANFYNMQYTNQLVLNGQINDVGAYNRINVYKSYRRGLELELNANITKYITFNGNITFSQNKVKQFKQYIDDYDTYGQDSIEYKNTDISFSPNTIAAANITFKPIKNLELTILNKYVGEQYLDNTQSSDKMMHDYLVTDFRVNYAIHTKAIKEINLIAVVYNLANTLYENNGYNYSYYMTDAGTRKLYSSNYLSPAAPTNFMFGVNLKF